MNNFHSDSKLKYRKRWIAFQLKKALSEFPVIILTGARQVGKSTLLLNEPPFNQWKYLSLDDYNILEQALEDPSSLLLKAKKIVIDEVQMAPELLQAIKIAVDKKMGKFVLSGSANILLMRRVAESLAGRAIYFILYPMTKKETEGELPPGWFFEIFDGKLLGEKRVEGKNPLSYIHKGFMPVLLTIKENDNIVRWWEGYVATYLERDLRSLSNIMSLVDFRRMMTVLALRTGNILNQTEIARDSGLSQPTVFRYLNLLEAGHIIERIYPFFTNRTKRIIKSPKVYWIDPALPVFLGGYYDTNSLSKARELGSFFENLIFLHLRVLCQQLIPRANIYYYREFSQKEVDFIIEYGKKLIAVEVKLTKNIHFSDTKNLRYFLKEYPSAKAGIVIYTGDEIIKYSKKIIAIPWTTL